MQNDQEHETLILLFLCFNTILPSYFLHTFMLKLQIQHKKSPKNHKHVKDIIVHLQQIFVEPCTRQLVPIFITNYERLINGFPDHHNMYVVLICNELILEKRKLSLEKRSVTLEETSCHI